MLNFSVPYKKHNELPFFWDKDGHRFPSGYMKLPSLPEANGLNSRQPKQSNTSQPKEDPKSV